MKYFFTICVKPCSQINHNILDYQFPWDPLNSVIPELTLRRIFTIGKAMVTKDKGHEVASDDAGSHLMPGWPVSGSGDQGLSVELRLI